MARNNAPRTRSAPRGAKQQDPPPQSRKSASTSGPAADVDFEIREFLEGLLEGFRAAAAANAAQGDAAPRQTKWFEQEDNRGGNWSDLSELEKSLPQFSGGVETYRDQQAQNSRGNANVSSPSRGAQSAPSSAGGGFATDPLSTMMRRHALRAFLEEMCGSVAKAFEHMAALAVKSSLGSQGGSGLPDQRMKYKFAPSEFQKTLSSMGYGVGAGTDWWRALFKCIDVDEDGAVSLQDMYDALVLDLPPLPGNQAATAGSSVYFQSPDNQRTLSPNSRAFSPDNQRTMKQHVFSPASRGSPVSSAGGVGGKCSTCGTALNRGVPYCDFCGADQ